MKSPKAQIFGDTAAINLPTLRSRCGDRSTCARVKINQIFRRPVPGIRPKTQISGGETAVAWQPIEESLRRSFQLFPAGPLRTGILQTFRVLLPRRPAARRGLGRRALPDAGGIQGIKTSRKI